MDATTWLKLIDFMIGKRVSDLTARSTKGKLFVSAQRVVERSCFVIQPVSHLFALRSLSKLSDANLTLIRLALSLLAFR